MNILAVIPSRYASTRLPGKPLVDICGKPMIQRVCERAAMSKLISSVIVATDDARIESAVKKFGGTVVMTAPEIQSGSDRIAAVAKTLQADIVVNIQGDEPLIEPSMIDQTIQTLIDDRDAVVGTAVKRISDIKDLFNPNVVKVALDKNNVALYFSRSPIPFNRDAGKNDAWLPSAFYYKHFGLYVYRSDFLQVFTSLPASKLEQAEKLEQLRILENGYHIKCAVTEYDSYPVDTQDDLERVKQMIQQEK